jgi:hypothetical protein
MQPKGKLAAARKANRQNMNHRIQGMAHTGPNPEYLITRGRDTPVYVQSGADGGIRISHGKTRIALDPDEAAELIRVGRRLTRPAHHAKEPAQ